MDRHDQARSWCITLPVTLLMCSAMAAAAVGATNSQVECDRIGKDLQSFEIPINELTIDAVDHMAAGADTALGDGLDAAVPVRATAAPVLVLTPRIAGILQDVFDSDSDAAASDDAEGAVPEATELAEPLEKMAPVTLIDEDDGISQFQRQMYRKDI